MTETDLAIEQACEGAEEWLASLPEWPAHIVADDSVSSHFGPTILSEADCVLQFARHLHEAGVPWEDMHFELSRSKWLFAAPHPAMVDRVRWRTDLAVVRRDDLMAAQLPDSSGAFAFDAFLEFKLASNHWKFGPPYGDPARTRSAVEEDIAKVSAYVERGLCRVAYVVVFEECDHEFPPGFEAAAEATPGIRVRRLRGWARDAV
jgi:hypothetical protein